MWCVVCGARRWCVGWFVAGVWCGWSLATPGKGFLCATPRHSWLGFAAGGGVRLPATPGWGPPVVVVCFTGGGCPLLCVFVVCVCVRGGRAVLCVACLWCLRRWWCGLVVRWCVFRVCWCVWLRVEGLTDNVITLAANILAATTDAWDVAVGHPIGRKDRVQGTEDTLTPDLMNHLATLTSPPEQHDRKTEGPKVTDWAAFNDKPPDTPTVTLTCHQHTW